LILFENDAEKCIINSMSEDKIKKNLQENIIYNSKKSCKKRKDCHKDHPTAKKIFKKIHN
jgi:hypothetical protein